MYIRANDSRADRRGTDDTPYEGIQQTFIQQTTVYTATVYTVYNRLYSKQPRPRETTASTISSIIG